jgi:photosystem II stability/assembly factor-like uncharacterized protein
MGTMSTLLLATDSAVLRVDTADGSVRQARGLEGYHPTFLASAPAEPGRAWCATSRGGLFRSDDGGASWEPSGLDGEHLMTVTVSPSAPDLVWAGTEPSALWRSEDGGGRWEPVLGMLELPSSSEWSFPPKPQTHHVRWIACHPSDPGRLWLAIEAGALITTPDGGRTWKDRVTGGPYDTHELAIHPAEPDKLRVAAGDGYYDSVDGGRSWSPHEDGLDITYLRSAAIDPGDPSVVVVSGASGPRSAYVAGHADGRVYRREGTGAWERITRGWPEPPETIAPLLTPGTAAGELWAADERGVHASTDGGRSWSRAAALDRTPNHLRGFVVLNATP